MKTPESYEKADIKKFLLSHGPEHCWFFSPHMRGYGENGIPDIVGSLHGACFGIEVKRPGKEPTVVQRKRMAAIARTNGIAFAGTAEVVIQDIRDWLAVRGIVV